MVDKLAFWVPNVAISLTFIEQILVYNTLYFELNDIDCTTIGNGIDDYLTKAYSIWSKWK